MDGETLVANHQLLSARPSGGRASLLMEDVPIDAAGMTSWTSRVYENDVAGPVNELLEALPRPVLEQASSAAGLRKGRSEVAVRVCQG